MILRWKDVLSEVRNKTKPHKLVRLIVCKAKITVTKAQCVLRGVKIASSAGWARRRSLGRAAKTHKGIKNSKKRTDKGGIRTHAPCETRKSTDVEFKDSDIPEPCALDHSATLPLLSNLSPYGAPLEQKHGYNYYFERSDRL